MIDRRAAGDADDLTGFTAGDRGLFEIAIRECCIGVGERGVGVDGEDVPCGQEHDVDAREISQRPIQVILGTDRIGVDHRRSGMDRRQVVHDFSGGVESRERAALSQDECARGTTFGEQPQRPEYRLFGGRGELFGHHDIEATVFSDVMVCSQF